MTDDFLEHKLNERRAHNAFRQLRLPQGKTDFCSNDYLGIATDGLIEKAWVAAASVGATAMKGAADVADTAAATAVKAAAVAADGQALPHGSGGSRLLAGNYPLIESTERAIATFHKAPAGLLFNSGYDANLGVLSSVPQRGDTILYDSLSHASIRDGIRLSFAKAYPFTHNDMAHLEKRLQAAQSAPRPVHEGTGTAHTGRSSAGSVAASVDPGEADPGRSGTLFVVTESVFSMDGDFAPLEAISALCRQYGARLIVDEAHGTGVVGPNGEGLVQALGLEEACFARIHTFGKAVGCHGAIVLGSQRLRDYLINFSRAFIYTTALPPASVRAIATAYELIPRLETQRHHLQQLIKTFREASIAFQKLDSLTPIQVVIVPGNEQVKQLAARLQAANLDVRPILYPTVPKDSERLRIVLHAFNTMEELEALIAGLSA